MTNQTYTLPATYEAGNEGEGMEVEITFSYIAGSPETPPSYASGGEPATADEIEFISCRAINGLLMPEFAQSPLNDWAEEYLHSDHGYNAACQTVADDHRDYMEDYEP